jgi:HAD superfamily, subfamily IIIB (Acid phosphatase)
VVQQRDDVYIGQICKIYMVYYCVVRMTVPNLPTTVLFDIDGTLANIDHRRAFLTKEPPDWKAFNAEMGNDVPNPSVVSLYKALWNANSYEMILVTGRSQCSRALTEQWLAWNEIPFSRLLMRADHDFRADHIIKEELLDLLLAEGKEIAFTVDDRQQVVDMWRRPGITCLQCDVGNF